jgi:hypothetical protein
MENRKQETGNGRTPGTPSKAANQFADFTFPVSGFLFSICLLFSPMSVLPTRIDPRSEACRVNYAAMLEQVIRRDLARH